jgi:hypothetical protein
MSLPGVRSGCEIKQLTANTKSILVTETKHTTSWQEHYLNHRFMVLKPSNTEETHYLFSGFGGLVVRILASGTQDRGFAPSQGRWIFSGEKILRMPSFGREVKPFAPCRRFVAC